MARNGDVTRHLPAEFWLFVRVLALGKTKEKRLNPVLSFGLLVCSIYNLFLFSTESQLAHPQPKNTGMPVIKSKRFVPFIGNCWCWWW